MFIRGAKVRHHGGRSSPLTPEVAALKAWQLGRSRVYAGRKHGQKLAFTYALISAYLQIMSPLVLTSQRKRAKQLAFLTGVLSSLRDGGVYSSAEN